MCLETLKTISLEYRRICPEAKPPFRKRDTDAGYDLSSVSDVKIPPRSFCMIPTGLQISPPPGYYYTIEGRSGMIRDGIIARRGVIDATYTGDIFVILYNSTDQDYYVRCGDRVAQIIVQEIQHCDFIEVDEFSEEYDRRGKDGWGASGK